MNWVALLCTLLSAAADYCKWQAALARIQARKLVYEIDQDVIKKGQKIQAQIDSARNASELATASRLLDDAAANALYVANVRSAIPAGSGWFDVGERGGVPTSAAPGPRPNDGSKPTPRAK